MNLASRLEYLDSLRGVAVMLMMLQHSALVLMDLSLVDSFPYVLMVFLGMFSAPMFLLLVGAGLYISVERRRARGENELRIRKHVLKRGSVLMVFGLLFMFVWEGEILRYIGIFIMLTYYFLLLHTRTQLVAGLVIVALSSALKYSPLLNWGGFPEGLFFRNSWDYSKFIYRIYGDGYSMVFLWFSFVVFGSVLGSVLIRFVRQGREQAFQSMALKLGLLLSSLGALEPFFMIPVDDFPALHVMLTLGVSLIVLSGLIWWNRRRRHVSRLFGALALYGRLSLSIYIGHIIIWLGALELLGLTLDLSLLGVIAALSSCYVFTWAFGVYWLKIRDTGPLELIVTRLVG